MRQFDHEKMEVYQRALDFVKFADQLRPSVLRRRASLADQLDRASDSIVLNIAEGAGEFAKREKARFYRIARRSATECAAILDILMKLELAQTEQLEGAKRSLSVIVAMLIGLVKHCEQRATSDRDLRS
jgi:four helix bundle protein